MAKNEIIFEDLHGVTDDDEVSVDLDKEDEDDHGITRKPKKTGDDDDTNKNRRGQGEDDDLWDDEDDYTRKLEDDDDDEGDDDDYDDQGEDEDDDAYSKRVKARIERERRTTQRERERADYWEQQAKKAAKTAIDERVTKAKDTLKRVDSSIEKTQENLERAIENGETKDQVRLMDELTDLKAERYQAQFEIDNPPADTGEPPPSGDRVPPDSTQPAKAKRWIERHSDWYGARGFERQTRLANRIDREVHADGYDPNTDEYYKELTRRIKRKAPEVFDEPGGSRKKRRRRRSPVGGVGGADNARRSTRGGKVDLTEADFANMRRFNLDPNDPEVLKEYARNKREAEATGDR